MSGAWPPAPADPEPRPPALADPEPRPPALADPEPRPIPPLDLRLAGPAAGAWLGAFSGTASPAVAFALCVVVVVGVAVALTVAGRMSRFPLRPIVIALIATGVCTVSAAGVGLASAAMVRAGPLDELAQERAVARVRAVVAADPTIFEPPAGSVRRTTPLSVVRVRVTEVAARGRTTTVRSPVLVLAGAPGWRGLIPGQRVEAVGRLAPARPGQPLAAVLNVRTAPASVSRSPLAQRAAGHLRAGLRKATDGLPPAERGLVPGLVVGDTSRMPEDLEGDFQRAGLTHLTAVSGANLAIVTGAVLLAGRWIGVRGRALPVLAALAMLGFVVLARPQPSVLRAAVMGGIALAALATGRERRSEAALSAAVIGLVLVDPWLARSYGFVLSVLATGGLVLLAPGWAAAWAARGVPLRVAQLLAAPLAAQLVCAPVVVLLSSEVSLVAVAANVLVAPAIAPATVLGVVATVLSPLSASAAAAVAVVAGWFVAWVVFVARHAADMPWAALPWSGSPLAAAALALLTVVGIFVARWSVRRPRRLALVAVVVVAGLVAGVVPTPGRTWPPDDWRMAVCDVGQGDALALAAGPNTAVVVDAGPDADAVDRCLRLLGVRHVPLVVLTHLHADHVAGLSGVLRGRRVGVVQVGSVADPPGELRRVRSLARRAKAEVRVGSYGERGRVGGYLRWRLLWPRRVIHAGSVPNNASQVLLVRTSGLRLLLLGDVEPEAQRALLSAADMPAVDVMKVAHHGSAAQEPALLSATRPRLALIPAGRDNDYGHPAPETLAGLRRVGAVVGRTDRQGLLIVAGDRRTLRLVASGG